MKKVLTIGALVVGIMLATVGVAQAHHNTITGSMVCNQRTWQFDVTWTVRNSESDKSEVITASTNPSIVPVGTVIGAGQTRSFTGPVNGLGQSTITLSARWSNGVTNTASGLTQTNGECERPKEPSTYRVGAKMQRVSGISSPAQAPLVVVCSNGTAEVTYVRAPGFLAAGIKCESGETGSILFKAYPNHNTVMRISGPGLYVETWSRLRGSPPLSFMA